MKKRFLGVLLCGVMLMTVVGCGNNENQDDNGKHDTNNEETKYPITVNGKGYELNSVVPFTVELKGSNNDYNTKSFGLVINIMKKDSSMEDILDSFEIVDSEYNYVDALKGGPIDQDIYEGDYFNFQLKYEIANQKCYEDPDNCEKIDFSKDLKFLAEKIKITQPGDYKISVETYEDYSSLSNKIESTLTIS